MSSSPQCLTPAQEALLPADKHDFASVTHLTNLPISQLQHLIPQLLAWLQDENWPIFGPVRDILLQNPKEIVQSVREVLGGEDEHWIYNCLVCLVAQIPKECQMELKAEIEKLARNHNIDKREFENEEVAEVAEVAVEIWKGLSAAEDEDAR